MKKLVVFAIVVLLCVAGWAAAVYVIGGKVEKQYHSFIDEHDRFGPITLTDQSYQRGFFSSTAETLIEMTFPKAPTEESAEPSLETKQLVFEHTIYHGPLPLGAGQGSLVPSLALIDTRIVIPSGETEDFEKFLQEIPELKDSFAHIIVNFDSSATGRMEIPPFEKQDDEGTFTWGGLTMTADYAPGPGTLVGTVDLENVDARFEKGSMRWYGIHGTFDLVEVLPMLFVGQNQIVSGGMNLQIVNEASGMKKVMDVKEFRIVADSNYDGRLVHASETITFDGATFDGETYGPLEIDLELKNMSGQALSDFQEKAMNFYGEVDHFNPEEMVAELIPLYSDLAVQLMAESPEFNINRFYVNTPMGEASGTLNVKYDNPQQEAPADLASLPQYIPFFNVSADLTADQNLVKSILKGNVKKQIQAAAVNGNQPEMSELEIEALVNQQIEMQLQMFAAQSFIVLKAEKVQSSITFSGGQLQVNGKPMPIFGQP